MELQSERASMEQSIRAELTTRLPGKVFFPTDAQYDELRAGYNAAVQQHPQVIVRAESAQDVAAAVSFARQQGLPVAVQNTAHGVKREANDALLIIVSPMNGVRIDPQAQTAWVEGGAKWGDVLPAAQAHGLTPLLGSSSDVGAVGYTLGGGWGWLTRKFGLSSDNVLRFEVVTADGELRTASESENPDLFWALRGGGGGFGVVTGMEIRLHPVTEVYAGNVHYPASMAKEVFQRFREWVSGAPDELSASIVLINYPPLPDLPPFLQGQSFVIVRACYVGEPEEGERLVSFWREWQQPVIDEFKVLPFTQADQISQDPPDPIPFTGTGGWLRDLSDETADTLIQFTLPQGGPPALIFTEVRLAGGAVARMDPDTNAYSNREEMFNWISLALVMSPEMAAGAGQQFAALQQALQPHLSGKVYMNFIEREEAALRARDGFSEKNFRRLQEIKAKYDPENRFSYAYAIPPA